MKSAKAILLITAVSGLLWFLLAGSKARQETRDRQNRSEALAAAAPDKIHARYVLTQANFGALGSDSEGLHELAEVLKARGWVRDVDRPGLPLAWNDTTHKGAFYRHGWIWVGDASGKLLKSIWYEPDLKADGKIQWSLDGTQLRLKADGWRHWLNLDLELN